MNSPESGCIVPCGSFINYSGRLRANASKSCMTRESMRNLLSPSDSVVQPTAIVKANLQNEDYLIPTPRQH